MPELKYPILGFLSIPIPDRKKGGRRVVTTLLRKMRKEGGVTQAELANRLGRPQSYVSKIESGNRSLELWEIHEIAQALGTTVETMAKNFRELSDEAE